MSCKNAYLSCVCFVSIYLSSVFNSKQFFWPDIRLSGQPDIRPDIRQTKPDIRPDTGYQKRPDIRCNPNIYLYYFRARIKRNVLMFLKNVYLNSLGEKKNVGEEKKGKGRFSQKKNQEGRGKNKGRFKRLQRKN